MTSRCDSKCCNSALCEIACIYVVKVFSYFLENVQQSKLNSDMAFRRGRSWDLFNSNIYMTPLAKIWDNQNFPYLIYTDLYKYYRSRLLLYSYVFIFDLSLKLLSRPLIFFWNGTLCSIFAVLFFNFFFFLHSSTSLDSCSNYTWTKRELKSHEWSTVAQNKPCGNW